MRSRLITGIFLFFFGLILCLVTFIYPKSETTTIQLPPGSNGKAEVTFVQPVRGWVSDKLNFMLAYTPDVAKTADTIQQYSARLEIGGVEVKPQGTITANVQAGEAVKFKWQVRAAGSGDFKGILWVFRQNAAGEKVLLFAKEFEFSTNNYLGVDPFSARSVALFSLVVGMGLCLSVWRLLFKS